MEKCPYCWLTVENPCDEAQNNLCAEASEKLLSQQAGFRPTTMSVSDSLRRADIWSLNVFSRDLCALVVLAGEVRRLTAERDTLRAAAARYETVCYLGPGAYSDACTLSRRTGKPVDEIIDQLRPFLRGVVA